MYIYIYRFEILFGINLLLDTLALSVRAVKYTDCITDMRLTIRWQGSSIGALGNMEYPFVAITERGLSTRQMCAKKRTTEFRLRILSTECVYKSYAY